MIRIVRELLPYGVSPVIVGSFWLAGSLLHFPLASVNWEAGKHLFARRCSVCHDVEPGGSARYGPSLYRIADRAGNRIANKSAEEYLIESIVRPGAYRQPQEVEVMPENVSRGLKREQIISLVGYLMTLGGEPNYRQLALLLETINEPEPSESRLEIDFAAADAGKRLFLTKGKCIQCHALRNLPGSNLRAPSLFSRMNRGRKQVIDAIRQPSKQITAGYEDWHVWLRSGKMHSGRLIRHAPDSVELLTESPSGVLMVKKIRTADIATDREGDLEVRRSDVSSMPDDLPLTDTEVELIATFVETL